MRSAVRFVLLVALLASSRLGATVMDGSETLRNVVDVMVAFDIGAEELLAARGLDAEELADRQIDLANEALANSGLGDLFEFRLVRVATLGVRVRDYEIRAGETEAKHRFNWMISQYRSVSESPEDVEDPAWFELAAACEEVGADVLMAIVDTGCATGMTGLSNGLEVMDPRYPWNSPYLLDLYVPTAIGSCDLNAVLKGYTFQHELGHMLGAGHASADQVNAASIPVGPQLFSDSCAYLFDCGGTLHTTLMGYTYDGYGHDCERILCYSTPELTFRDASGADTGIPLGVAGRYDNVRAIREAYPFVAQFRTHVVRCGDWLVRTACGAGGTLKTSYDGLYLPGTVLPLSAKPASGKVFAGWFVTNGPETNRLDGALDWRVADNAFTVGSEDVTLVAAFADKNRSADPVHAIVCEPREEYSYGQPAEVPVAVESASLPKVTVSGLPPGLRFDPARGCIVGVPTKPGCFDVKITARNASGAVLTATVTIVIGNIRAEDIPVEDAYGPLRIGRTAELDLSAAAGCTASGLPPGLSWKKASGFLTGRPTRAGRYTVTLTRTSGKVRSVATTTVTVVGLPAWAVGTYSGAATYDGVVGTMTLTTAASGKTSGKFCRAGKTHSFSAKGFSGEETDDGGNVRFRLDSKLKIAGEPVSNALAFAAVDYSPDVLTGRATADGDGIRARLWWDRWREKTPAAPTGSGGKHELAGWEESGLGDGDTLQLKLGSHGAVTFAGRIGKTKVSGSSRLALVSFRDGRTEAEVDVVVAPKPSAGFSGWARTVRFAATGDEAGRTRASEFAIISVTPVSNGHISYSGKGEN